MTSSPPPHWDNRRLKSLARIVNGGTPSSTVPEYWDGNIIWLTPDDLGKLNTAYVKTGARSITQEGYNSCSTTLAPAGSIVVSTRAPIGHTAILEADACVNQGCRILVPDKTIQTRYLYRSLTALKHELETRGKGTTFAELSHGDLGTVPIMVPPPSEQASIVHYLDHADELINRYISAKERLIALMEEQSQAVIHQAVTRGLDTSTAFEPFSVPELGDVPDHWEIVQLGRLGDFSKGSGGTKDDEVTEGLPCVRYGDIYTSHKYFVRQTRSFIARHRAHDYAPMKYGDVLFTGSGETIEDIGKSVVNLIDGEAYCGGDVILFRPRDKTHPEFLGYLLDSARAIHQKSSMGRGITIMHVYSSQLKYLCLALPPFADQVQIAAYLGKITNEVDQAIHGTQRQINLMNEYRTRLIADVVTGQIDVRGTAVELPTQHL